MLSKSYKSFQNQSTGSYQSAYCSCFSCSRHTHNKSVVFWKQHLFHCLFLRFIQTFKEEKITVKCLHFIIILARVITFNFAICRQVVQGLYCYLRNKSLKMFCDLLQLIVSDILKDHHMISCCYFIFHFSFYHTHFHIQTCKMNCTGSIILLRKKKKTTTRNQSCVSPVWCRWAV